MDDDLQQKIAAALEQKVPMSEIAARLASHENPEYSAYGKSFMESQAAPSTRRSDYQEPQKNLAGTITPFLDLINENPKTALGVGAAALAVPFAIKTKNAIEDRRMKRELHESEIAKNAAYAKQVDLQAQKLTTPADLTHTDVANMMKQERNVTGKPNPLAASFEQKFNMPLAEAEQLSGGKITNAIDAEIIGNTLTKGQGLSVNPIPGTVSNQPAGIPSAVNPMDRLTQQPPTPQMIQPKAVAPTAVDTLAAGGTPTQIATQTAAQAIDEVSVPATAVPATPVKKTKGVKPPVETELRAGYEFRPGFGTSDTYLVDTIGPEKYKIARMELNEGKPFGKYDVNLVQDVMNKYRVGEKVTSEVAKAAGAGAMSSPGGVPSKSIQRGLKVGGVLGMGLPAWLAARASELPGYDEAMARAAEAVPGMGTAANAMPFSRGEEMSQMGRAYVTAGNPNYRAQLEQQLSIEKDPARVNQLIGELQKLGTVGAGRGIAPPSAYQR
jgi:hypothetical protein